MTDQPWVSDPSALQNLRATIAAAQAADRQPSAGPDPNADLLAQACGDLINAFRSTNPEIYDRLSSEFNTQFVNAICEGLRIGAQLAATVADGVRSVADDDDDVDDHAMTYIDSFASSLATVFERMQKELKSS